MSGPTEVMTVPWGPFARQCTDTYKSSYVMVSHGLRDRRVDNRSCTGFVTMPLAGGATEITASTSINGQSPTLLISRFVRAPGGVTRPAKPGDVGLLAQGSDSPALAARLAEEIGVPHAQIINPDSTLHLPIHLEVGSPIDGLLSCRPHGRGVDHGRQTLMMTCTMDLAVDTDRLDAVVRLAGIEEIDVLTGVRLSSALSGSVSGNERRDVQSSWQRADYHVWYQRVTEFE